MSSLIRGQSQTQLTPETLRAVVKEIQSRLHGRVSAAYIFGSASNGTFNQESDIDLILVKSDPHPKFVERGFEFADLFEIWPKLDILVYTPREFEEQLNDAKLGFWKDVKATLNQIL